MKNEDQRNFINLNQLSFICRFGSKKAMARLLNVKQLSLQIC